MQPDTGLKGYSLVVTRIAMAPVANDRCLVTRNRREPTLGKQASTSRISPDGLCLPPYVTLVAISKDIEVSMWHSKARICH